MGTNTIGVIKKEAAGIQERLWDIAINSYGLERTQDTVERIQWTSLDEVTKQGNKCGAKMPTTRMSPHEPVDCGLAMAFMCAAWAENEKDPHEALSMLMLAGEALGMLKVIGMLKASGLELDEGTRRKIFASGMAKARHSENYAMADDAITYWRQNIDPCLSASKAANELMRVVPLSHKKLAEIVSAEKKKQPQR